MYSIVLYTVEMFSQFYDGEMIKWINLFTI